MVLLSEELSIFFQYVQQTKASELQCQDSTPPCLLWCRIVYQSIKTQTCPVFAVLCSYASPLAYIIFKDIFVSLITAFCMSMTEVKPLQF